MIDARRGGPNSEGAWYLRREYVLTYAADLPPANVVVRGHWWGPSEWTRPLVSVEEAVARQLGIGVGDRLTFEVQGVPVEAEVRSTRKVDWQTLSTNFFMILCRAPSMAHRARSSRRAEFPLPTRRVSRLPS